jgi:hypothetical protein
MNETNSFQYLGSLQVSFLKLQGMCQFFTALKYLKKRGLAAENWREPPSVPQK